MCVTPNPCGCGKHCFCTHLHFFDGDFILSTLPLQLVNDALLLVDVLLFLSDLRLQSKDGGLKGTENGEILVGEDQLDFYSSDRTRIELKDVLSCRLDVTRYITASFAVTIYDSYSTILTAPTVSIKDSTHAQ